MFLLAPRWNPRAAGVRGAGTASAFHPGETHSGDVPQGPEWIACENPGWTGIEIAIGVGGMVHCDDFVEVEDDDGEDGGTVE